MTSSSGSTSSSSSSSLSSRRKGKKKAGEDPSGRPPTLGDTQHARSGISRRAAKRRAARSSASAALYSQASHSELSRLSSVHETSTKTKPTVASQIKANRWYICQYTTFFIYLAVATIVATNLRPSIESFYLTDNLKYRFVERTLDLPSSEKDTVLEVRDAADFWSYAEQYLIPGAFEDIGPDGSLLFNASAPNATRYLLGANVVVGARLLQHRVRPGTCPENNDLAVLFDTCYGAWSNGAESTASYGKGNVTFTHTDEIESKRGISARVNNYPADRGFISFFPSNATLSESLAQLRSLRDNGWVDRATRLVAAQIAVYNPQLLEFAVVEIYFEFLESGGVSTYYELVSVALQTGSLRASAASVAGEAILVVLTLYYICEECYELVTMRCCAYIKDAWNAVDLASTVLFLLFLILRFSGVTAINQLVVENDKVDFNDVLGVAGSSRNTVRLLALAIFAVWFRTFKYLEASARLNQLVKTLSRASTDLIAFGSMFVIIIVGFSLSSMLVFGSRISGYARFGETFMELVRTLLGDFDYDAVFLADAQFGPAFFLLFAFIVVFFLLNMFLAIVADAYSEVRDEYLKEKFVDTPLWMFLTTIGSKIATTCPKAAPEDIQRRLGEEMVGIDANDDHVWDEAEIQAMIDANHSDFSDMLGIKNARQMINFYDMDGDQVIDEKEQAALFRMLRGSDVDKRVMLRMQGTVLDSTAEMNNRLVGLEDQITAIHEALADIATKVGA